jgi:hypothetical protein
VVVLLCGVGAALAEDLSIPEYAPDAEAVGPSYDRASPPFGRHFVDDEIYPRVWGSAEYLMSWFKGSPAPVPLAGLVSASLANGAFPQPGVTPTPMPVLGGADIDTGMHHGARLTLGAWLDCESTFGLEASYFMIFQGSSNQSATPFGSNELVVPYFDVTTRSPNFFVISTVPSVTVTGIGAPETGAATLRATSRLQGGELNALAQLGSAGFFRMDLLGGFRYLDLREELDFNTFSQVVGDPGTTFTTADLFGTVNRFYGGQLGLSAEMVLACGVCAGLTAKCALGVMDETVNINGTTTRVSDRRGVSNATFAGGKAFAEPSNIGNYGRAQFAVVPEVGLNVGYDVTCWLRIFAGYSFLYINEVARPGDQISPFVNPSQRPLTNPLGNPGPLVGPRAPVFNFNGTDFWAQTINAGVLLRY